MVMVTEPHEVVSENITHNVNKMWMKAGIYDDLYGSGGKKVSDVLFKLERGLVYMIDNPEIFIPLNPENGWGSYDGTVSWLRNLISELKQYPNGTIEISA